MFAESRERHETLASISTEYRTPWPLELAQRSFSAAGIKQRIPILGREEQLSPVDAEAGSVRNLPTALEQRDSAARPKEGTPRPPTPRDRRGILPNEGQLSRIDEEAGSVPRSHIAYEQRDHEAGPKKADIEVLVPTAPLWITLCVLVIVTGVRTLAAYISYKMSSQLSLCAARREQRPLPR
jgi:hypothetical protein